MYYWHNPLLFLVKRPVPHALEDQGLSSLEYAAPTKNITQYIWKDENVRQEELT